MGIDIKRYSQLWWLDPGRNYLGAEGPRCILSCDGWIQGRNYLAPSAFEKKFPSIMAPSAFEKKFPSIYINIKNLLLALKLIYLAPSQTIYKFHEIKNEKKLSNHPLSGCPKNIKKNI